MAGLVVLSNRIPLDDGGSGGLVVAMHDCLSNEGGLWIGSSGDLSDAPENRLRELESDAPYRRLAYDLSPAEHETFYLGYANSVLWPLFHHRSDLMDLQDGYREGYLAVNDRVARMLAEVLQPDDLIWVHDYHFLPMADRLRKLGVRNRIGFFLHIPFPHPSETPALPHYEELGDWLAAFDVVGLQTATDVTNCQGFLAGQGAKGPDDDGMMRFGGRRFLVRSFPIGIDADAYAQVAANSHGADTIAMAPGQKLVLGVDRLDYSKGLVNRFQAFGAYLEQREDSVQRPTLLQIAPPTREEVKAYREIRTELEAMTGAVNGQHSELDWTPIRYIHRSVDRDALAGIYRRADVCIVTPLADGMNLVAKEFVAAQDAGDPGVLILSHFAGAADQLSAALIVNPYDVSEVAGAIGTALMMPLGERRRRHAELLKNVREEDIGWWSDNFLACLRAEFPTTLAPA